MTEQLYVQRDQPDGVPPLHLTGERTLPDVPEENYWYRRHLVVYEWIAQRAHGRRVVDLACGEGYGSAVLAPTAGSRWSASTPTPRPSSTPARKYPQVSFERNMIELWQGDVDCVVFLQTIEHIQDPDAMLAHVRELIGPGGVAYVSTPNVLTLAPKGEERSGNPWHVREYKPGEYRELCERHFSRVDLLGLFHARKLRAHQVAIERLGWDHVHKAPALHQAVLRPLHARDQRARLRAAARRPRARARPRRGPAPVTPPSASSCTPTCPTSRASGRGRSARSGCGRRSRPATCRCSTCSTRTRARSRSRSRRCSPTSSRRRARSSAA